MVQSALQLRKNYFISKKFDLTKKHFIHQPSIEEKFSVPFPTNKIDRLLSRKWPLNCGKYDGSSPPALAVSCLLYQVVEEISK